MTEQEIEQLEKIATGLEIRLSELRAIIDTARGSVIENISERDMILIECATRVNGTTPHFLIRNSSRRNVVYARRFIWMWLRENTKTSLAEISKFYNRTENHSNALKGIQEMNNLLDVDKDIQAKWAKFKQLVNDRLN